MKIITIADNNCSENHNLYVEHGLSFLIETNESKFIFDFGSGKNIIRNAKEMNIKLSEVNLAVCSHSHYDHGNGFPDLIEEAPIKSLITGPGFFNPKYGYDGIKYTYLGVNFDEDFLKENNINHKVCKDILEIDSQSYLIGDFSSCNSFETIQSRFVRKEGNEYIEDDFRDEICLVLRSEKGLIVVVGCSHPGIINMLKHISSRFDEPIYAVLGGTHLVEADEKRILIIIEEMKKIGVELLCLSHCSGDLANEIIEKDKEILSCRIGVGDCIRI